MKRTSLFPTIIALLLSCTLALAGCNSQDQMVPSAAAEDQATPEDQEASDLSETTSIDSDDSGNDPASASVSFVTQASESANVSAAVNASASASASAAVNASTAANRSGTSSGKKPGQTAQNHSMAGALHVSGTQLCDSAGNPVQLRGISTHGLAWFPDYVNENCFADFKNNWNANVIRLAMYTAEYGGYCSGGDTSSLKKLVRNGIKYAANQDLYVIVDWHILSDSNPNSHVSEAKSFFDEISSEFSSSTHILYEICNEPNGGTSWSDIKSYALKVIPVIRANDPDAVIIVGTPNWSQYVDQAAADPITEYDNIMYALHFYAATHKGDLRNKMSSAISKGLPIFVTEYGICDASGNGGLDIDQANQWVDAMDKNGVSYVAWNLSNKNESSAILKSSCSKTSGFTQEDLSDSGKWLYETLTGHTGGPAPAPSNNENKAPAAPSKEPEASTPAPAPESPPAPAPAPETNTSSGSAMTNDNGIEATASIINSWENDGLPYFQYDLTLKNTTGQNCSSWTIHLPCESGMSLSDSWNGVYTVSNGQLTIFCMDYNGSIPAGGSINNIGFIVNSGKLQ